MFDLVKRSELDAEKERRIRAEAEGDASAREVNRLLDVLAAERVARENDSVRYHRQVDALLEHLVPKAQPALGPTAGDGQDNQTTTAKDAELIPAVGKKAIEDKRRLIAELRAQESSKHPKNEGSNAETDDALTEAEMRRVSEVA